MIFWSTRGRSDGFCWPHFKRAIIFLEWLQNKQFSNIQDSFKNWAPGLLAALKAGGKSCSGADGNSPHITSGEEVLNAIKSLSGGRSWSLLSGSSGHLISGQKVAPAPSGISGHQEACIFSSKSLWNSTCHCRLKQYSLNPFKSMIVVTVCNNHQCYVICHIRVMHGYCTCKTSSFFWLHFLFEVYGQKADRSFCVLQTERLLRLGRWSFFDWARQLKIWCKGDCSCWRRWVRWQIFHFVFPPETKRFMKWYSSTIYTCFIVFVIFLEGPRLRKLAHIHLIAEILHHQTHWQGITSWVHCPMRQKEPSTITRFSPVSLVLSPLIPQHGEAFDEILSSGWHRFTLHATTAHLNHFIELIRLQYRRLFYSETGWCWRNGGRKALYHNFMRTVIVHSYQGHFHVTVRTFSFKEFP